MALKIALGVIGGIFVLMSYEMVVLARQEPATSMMLSLYVTLGVFLLLAIRRPEEHRSLIAFAAWAQPGAWVVDGDAMPEGHGDAQRANRVGNVCGDLGGAGGLATQRQATNARKLR